MDAIEMIKDRRSVRKFKKEKVDRETMREIIELSRWAPSWANYQIARYTLVDDKATLGQLANDGVKGFVYNMKTLQNATGVAVLSFVKGKSGRLDQAKLDLMKEELSDANATIWEAFDAGIACQTFCLAAHAKGVGTCIFGVINETSIAQAVHLPEEETVAALIAYGYEDGPHAKPTPRKEIDEIMRFI
ncbi:nitroreductase family protein [Desulfobulbus rhabdoformis]|uniref:nitroreductase family protein n=1 Tax=Desulfobulbus rhabdoformis TaxID=34032 RepID=UPI0019624448|nr:nitroreductase family protein [Desulfobulbus rhabdoformis]MBM9612674.1 nitroreductase family protein [Desulfobulbus rhabdoformis]